MPERHEAVTIRLPEPLPYVMPMVMDLVYGGGGTGLNFRHDRPGQLVTEIHKPTGTGIADPDDYSDQIDEASKEHLAELLLERLPGLSGAGFGHGWAGLYPESVDRCPLVGPFDGEPHLVAAANRRLWHPAQSDHRGTRRRLDHEGRADHVARGSSIATRRHESAQVSASADGVQPASLRHGDKSHIIWAQGDDQLGRLSVDFCLSGTGGKSTSSRLDQRLRRLSLMPLARRNERGIPTPLELSAGFSHLPMAF